MYQPRKRFMIIKKMLPKNKKLSLLIINSRVEQQKMEEKWNQIFHFSFNDSLKFHVDLLKSHLHRINVKNSPQQPKKKWKMKNISRIIFSLSCSAHTLYKIVYIRRTPSIKPASNNIIITLSTHMDYKKCRHHWLPFYENIHIWDERANIYIKIAFIKPVAVNGLPTDERKKKPIKFLLIFWPNLAFVFHYGSKRIK